MTHRIGALIVAAGLSLFSLSSSAQEWKNGGGGGGNGNGMTTSGSNATAAALGNIVGVGTGCGGTTNFVRADGTCQTPAGGGNVSTSGTITLGTVATWITSTTIAGTQAIGTSGATLPLLNGANTWSGVQTFTNGNLSLAGSTSGSSLLEAPATATGTYTLPTIPGTQQCIDITSGGAFGTTGADCRVLTVGTNSITGGTSTYILYNNAGVLGNEQTVPVANGGTALTSGTSGGILGFTASGTLASSVALGASQIVIGGGAGATPTSDASATLTAGALSLGASGTAGSVAMGNATSGTVTLQPVTGALGSVTASLPANTGTIAETNLAQTFSAVQSINSGDLSLSGSSSGASVLNAPATGGGTVTLPAGTVTLMTTTFSNASGTLAVANGGTNLASGTSGGILGYTATGTLASSALLTANALLLGGGAGATPTALGSLGTTTTVLHGNASGAPSFGAVVLTTDISGILPVANGGTGIASGTSGGILGYTATGTLASSALLGANQIVIGGGAGATPASDANATLSAGALSLGASGTSGSVVMGNATSGTITLQPVIGALGSVTASLPANTGTIAETNLAQTWSAVQTFNNGDISLAGSTSGSALLEPPATATGTYTLPTIPGSTQCLQISSAGTMSATGSVCGSGGGTQSPIFVGPLAGTAPTYTLASPTPSGFTLVNQYVVRGTIPSGQTNAGTATLNVATTGAVTIVTNSNGGFQTLTGGELQAGSEYDFTYNTASASPCSSSCWVMSWVPQTIVTPGTTQTVTASQWASADTFDVTSSGQTLTIPAVSTLSANGAFFINTGANNVTIAPNSADAITYGSVVYATNTSVLLPAGTHALLTVNPSATHSLYLSATSTFAMASASALTASAYGAQ